MVTKPATKKTFSVDRLMLDVASTLVRDFQDSLHDPSFCCDYQKVLHSGDLTRIRQECPEASFDDDIPVFKRKYQIASVLKRYRFHKDIYSDADLTQEAIKGFLDTQRRIDAVNFDSLSSSTKWILDYASMYIRHILGEYSDEEHRSLCRFGKKASVGVPARSACEAARWELPITGSCKQISWFDSEMSKVACVQEYWAKQLESDPKGSIYREIDCLALTLVPKTFKSLRSIMPNSTIGSYMSYGLGEMIRKRLKRGGYDIRKLQMQHRDIARLASLHRRYVTADLSSASDSISVALVDRLLPPDWLEILHQSRIGCVVLPDGQRVESHTFCTMGVGYTFPLQTLVFLALLIAIQAWRKPRLEWERVSVYGDDLIYTDQIHPDVLRVFPQLGFVINVDKTFDRCGFRESCGGDYFHGVDVRPFQPRNGSAIVSQKAYEAMLYKCINGLLMRWSEHEIPHTLHYLCHQVSLVAGCVKLVPGDFPDDSGVKCPSLCTWDFLRTVKVAHPKHVGHGVFRFAYLRLKPDLRKENRHEPYLWSALRGHDPIVDYSNSGHRSEAPSPTVKRIETFAGISGREPFFIEEEEHGKTIRSKLTGRRLRRVLTCVVISHTGRYIRQYGTSGFWCRR
jgi:hypothetical protein